jgi:hypothetical protein
MRTARYCRRCAQAAKERARRRRIRRRGHFELARSAVAVPEPVRIGSPKAVFGFRPFPKRGGIVTNELIDQLRDDDAY